MAKRATSRKIKIEKNLKALEEIVSRFEKGDFGIAKGIEEYEKASKLIKDIKKELSSLELKIEEIRESY